MSATPKRASSAESGSTLVGGPAFVGIDDQGRVWGVGADCGDAVEIVATGEFDFEQRSVGVLGPRLGPMTSGSSSERV